MTRDHIIVACTAALAVGYLYATIQIPSLDTVDPLGPRAYPYLIFAGLAVSAIWLLFETRQSRTTTRQTDEIAADETSSPTNKHALMLAAVVVWLSLYYASITTIGFIISTFVFLIGLTSYFNPGKWTANVLVSLFFAVGVYFLFTVVLGVPLAKGVLDI